MRRSFNEWLWIVDDFMFSLAGVTTLDLPRGLHDYHHWWQTGTSPQWAARHALSMDNG